MKAAHVPPIVFILSYLAYLVYLASSAAQLPARVATHFNLAGQPNGWMTRAQCVAFSAAMGLGSSLFIVGLFFAVRFFPNGALNISRRDYWLAPERRATTFAYLFRHSFWLASMMIGFFAGLHWMMLQANRQGAALAHLSTPTVFASSGLLLIGTVVWSVCMFRHFR
jgi:uncharacterized membrane protein